MVIILVLFILPIIKASLYLFNTEDGSSLEYFDCINHENMPYCRRPDGPIALRRENMPWPCYNNGTAYMFTALQLSNISVSIVLHQWRSSIEKAEKYLRFIKRLHEFNEHLCQCNNPRSFGKNCEYLLPVGTTFEETLAWGVEARSVYLPAVQINGDIVCYKTLECNSGLLCLDWRDICDGVQQCMFGLDEENCDKLEFNECEDDEYRCMNGMCIPDEYFIDGELDCMDWSDEKQNFNDKYCAFEQVSYKCDDRVCPHYQWSCGDGQCIRYRLAFQTPSAAARCYSRRDSYHMCETHYVERLWTLPNGRCYIADQYVELNMAKFTEEQYCIYLFKCLLSSGAERYCSCDRRDSCAERFYSRCGRGRFQYPMGGIITPNGHNYYKGTRGWSTPHPDYIELEATVKCRGFISSINTAISYDVEYSPYSFEQWLCNNQINNVFIQNGGYHNFCHNNSMTFGGHPYNFIDVCTHSKECISAYRIQDGFRNCADGMDEEYRKSVSESCEKVKRHRFRCSVDEPTCLNAHHLGDTVRNCKNDYDESLMSTSGRISQMDCNAKWKQDCSVIREYIKVSWLLNITKDFSLQLKSTRTPFRVYCDKFWDLNTKEDENTDMCQKYWVCPEEQWQCRTGQCINVGWVLDGKWDCSDGSDEETIFAVDESISDRNLQHMKLISLQAKFATLYRIQPFSTICNLTREFPCFIINTTESFNNLTHNRPCIRQQQVGDGHIDCYGGTDEKNTIHHCDHQVMLSHNFKCLSDQYCIFYSSLCEKRCPNKSDDEFWCDRGQKSFNCSQNNDFLCLNGTCIKNGRCNGIAQCIHAEDEYLCYQSQRPEVEHYHDPNIFFKRKNLHLFKFPHDAISTEPSAETNHKTTSTAPSLFSPQTLSRISSFCNRGVGVLIYNGSIVCFCPPQYYGDKCQFHNDRLTILLHLSLSQSIYAEETNLAIVIKLVVIFLFQNQTLDIHEFHVRPGIENNIYKKKFGFFLYSRSLFFLRQKKARYFNRTNIINDHPYSILIEAYELKMNEKARPIAVWQYPIYFDYLPVFRLAKVLRLIKPNLDRNPCFSNPCSQNQHCQQIHNQRSKYICLCKSHFGGENCSTIDRMCANNYCSLNALCMSNRRSLLIGNESPYCICPYKYYGRKCEIVHDKCATNPCENGGSCFPTSVPDRVICWCSKYYYGNNCETKKLGVHLYINQSLEHIGAVIQYFDIEHRILGLIFLYQDIYRKLPTSIDYFHGQKTVPEIILVKLYNSHFMTHPTIHLISLHINSTSINGTTQVTDKTQCVRASTLFLQHTGSIYTYE